MSTAIFDHLALFILVCLLTCIYWRTRSRSSLPLPPGPPKLPIVGNLLQLRNATLPDHETYLKWGKRYGSDILHIDAAGVSVIMINSAEVVAELLEKRSRIYSSRHVLAPAPMVCDLMGWEWNFGFKPGWLASTSTYLSSDLQFNSCAAVPPSRAEGYPSTPTSVARKTGRLYFSFETVSCPLLIHPFSLREPHYRYVHPFFFDLHIHAASVVLSVAYGLDIKQEKDPYVAIADAALNPLLEALVPGKYLVDSFPMLKHVPPWIPGAGFQHKAKESKDLATTMVNKPFDDGKTLMETQGVPSFIASAIQNINDEKSPAQQEQVIREAAGSMYLAGADTTVSAISIFVLAMLYAPQAQFKAQEELDRVVPPGRLPDFTDQAELPYVTALVKESLRWKNVTPLGLPHYLEVEDEYNGYRIPANSLVFGNVWAILHDESLYPKPFEFKPERFLVEGKLSFEKTRDPTFAAFGFGRRVCPGRHMAEASIWIAVASILKIFHISKAVDEHGNTIEPTYECRSVVVTEPLPFKCSIRPRSTEAEQLVSLADEL
ncbi:cytochrome P450 [Marasmius fiardii PR-910]|nr:cytochrome P450 [Marasmius fiardii PR-910]